MVTLYIWSKTGKCTAPCEIEYYSLNKRIIELLISLQVLSQSVCLTDWSHELMTWLLDFHHAHCFYVLWFIYFFFSLIVAHGHLVCLPNAMHLFLDLISPNKWNDRLHIVCVSVCYSTGSIRSRPSRSRFTEKASVSDSVNLLRSSFSAPRICSSFVDSTFRCRLSHTAIEVPDTRYT